MADGFEDTLLGRLQRAQMDNFRKKLEEAEYGLRLANDRIRELERQIGDLSTKPANVFAKARGTREELREQVFELLGRSCRYCPQSDPRALDVDHKYDDGALHRSIASPIEVLQDVLRVGAAEYQIVCATCNRIKEAERRERKRLEKDKL